VNLFGEKVVGQPDGRTEGKNRDGDEERSKHNYRSQRQSHEDFCILQHSR
jgi:hypothetical protein